MTKEGTMLKIGYKFLDMKLGDDEIRESLLIRLSDGEIEELEGDINKEREERGDEDIVELYKEGNELVGECIDIRISNGRSE